MKILLVTPYFYPAWYFGGPPRAAFDFARFLVAAGHEVTVFSSDAKNRHERIGVTNCVVDGVHIFYFRNPSHFLTTRFSVYNPFKLRAALWKTIPTMDIVHINEFRTHMSFWAAAISQRLNKPSLLHVRGGLPNIMQRRWLKRMFDLVYGRKILRFVSKLIALHDDERDQALAIGIAPEKIFVAPNGIEIPPLDGLMSRPSARKTLAIIEPQTVIFYLGRIHKDKGLDLLFGALEKLRDHNWRLVLAGPDFGARRDLEKAAERCGLSERITWLGMIEGQDKMNWLRACDFLILPSRSEGIPGSVLEAMAHECPVIVTEHCHLNALEESGAGFVCRADMESLCTTLRTMLSFKDDVRRDMGKKGRQFTEKHYTWTKVVEKFETLYQTL